jgi:hypothetical protein
MESEAVLLRTGKVDTTVYTQNVTGDPADLPLNLIMRARLLLGSWLLPRQTTEKTSPDTAGEAWYKDDRKNSISIGIGLACLLSARAIGHYLMSNGIDVERSSIIIGIANGDLHTTGETVTREQSPRSNIVRMHVRRTGFKGARRTNHRHVRINALAGRVTDICRLRHGFLEDTKENRIIIRADTARKAEALQRDGDPEFKNLRTTDLYHCAMWASELFWVMTDDEMDLIEAMKDPLIKSRVQTRSKYASEPRSC